MGEKAKGGGGGGKPNPEAAQTRSAAARREPAGGRKEERAPRSRPAVLAAPSPQASRASHAAPIVPPPLPPLPPRPSPLHRPLHLRLQRAGAPPPSAAPRARRGRRAAQTAGARRAPTPTNRLLVVSAARDPQRRDLRAARLDPPSVGPALVLPCVPAPSPRPLAGGRPAAAATRRAAGIALVSPRPAASRGGTRRSRSPESSAEPWKAAAAIRRARRPPRDASTPGAIVPSIGCFAIGEPRADAPAAPQIGSESGRATAQGRGSRQRRSAAHASPSPLSSPRRPPDARSDALMRLRGSCTERPTNFDPSPLKCAGEGARGRTRAVGSADARGGGREKERGAERPV